MLEIVNFIKQNEDWQNLLSNPPYCLKIREKGNLLSFNYNQFSSDSSLRIVQEARGLILEKETFKVVKMGFIRFFNYGEPNAATLDTNSLFATEKIDGSLITAYYYENKWRWSTRSTFDAEEACVPNTDLTFDTLIRQAGSDKAEKMMDVNCTYVFELVSKESQIIVHYADTKMYFLMARDNRTLEEVTDKIDFDWERPKTFSVQTLEQISEYVSQFDGKEFEGVVVQDKDFKRVKVKNLGWFKLHKYFNKGSLSEKNLYSMVIDGEFLSYFPEHKDKIVQAERTYNNLLEKAKTLDGKGMVNEFPIRKDFILNLKAQKLPSIVEFFYIKAYDEKAEEWVRGIKAEDVLQLLSSL